MTEIWNEPWFWPAVGVVLGVPIALLVLTEIQSALERRGSRAARIISLIKNYVVPVGALLVLLAQVQFVREQPAWWQVTATIFGFVVILVVLNALNFGLFVTAKQGTWRSKVPSIFVDIARVLIILVLVAVLFGTVWNADVGGLFAALGVGSIVIGLALQNAVGGIVSGLLLLSEQPFQLGDWLLVNGTKGRVVEVNWRATHLWTSNGELVITNASLAEASFLNYSKAEGGFGADTMVKFATDDAPQDVIDVCRRVADDLPYTVPGETTSVAPFPKAKYEVEIPITSPGDAYKAIRMFRTRLWYAARRANLHLDGDLTDNFNTPANVLDAVLKFASALYLRQEDISVVAQQVRLERYGAGEIVQRVGEVPNGHRYILSGTTTMATPTDNGGLVPFATMDEGDVLGLSALTRQGLQASQTANTDLAVLFVPVGVLDDLVKTRPRLAKDVGTELDNRRTLAKTALDAVGANKAPGATRFLG
jgi:small-conductance mechanosensitive channel